MAKLLKIITDVILPCRKLRKLEKLMKRYTSSFVMKLERYRLFWHLDLLCLVQRLPFPN